MERFWLWLREYANRKIRKRYMDRVRHDRKCERCATWTSEVGGCKEIVDNGDFQLMTCKKCGHISKWNCTAMVPFLVKSL